ncbi:hypothetical protein ACFXC8_56150 [Streptomyces sp. NPDC059441]|uniref:hypothetical protein n=1 Tax=Streptomyces sp. NPDC059441 TaxID=3346829 RepID=UPI0036C06A6B
MTTATAALVPAPADSPEDTATPPAAPVAEIAAAITTALIAGWEAIRARHPEVPEAVITMATGGRESTMKLAHFSAKRWRLRQGDGVHHEVFVTAESLQGGAEEVFATLIHEGAHALNQARGVDDCSASQYHNKRFKTAAAELGLIQKPDVSDYFKKKYGFAGTTMSDETKEAYKEQIEALDAAIHATRVPNFYGVRGGRSRTGAKVDDDLDTEGYETEDGDEVEEEDGPQKPEREDRNYAKGVCQCDPPNVIRASPRTLRRGKVMCADCLGVFGPADED